MPSHLAKPGEPCGTDILSTVLTSVSALPAPRGLNRVQSVAPARTLPTGLNMTSTRPMQRLSSIALLAILGGLFTAGGASACDMSKDGGCATATPCCCDTPSARSSSQQAPSTLTSRPGPIRGVTACGATASGGCYCGTERPAAPEPKSGQRTSDRRPTTAPDLGLDLSDLLVYPSTLARSSPPTASPPQHTPLYLRTSRLLI